MAFLISSTVGEVEGWVGTLARPADPSGGGQRDLATLCRVEDALPNQAQPVL